MKLFNTLTREVEDFAPLDEANVRLFVCGPTVYGPMHAGHAKTYTQFDFIANVLRREYPSLRYAMNITDVDGKIINLAAETNSDPIDIARKWEARFWDSMKALGNHEVNEVYRAHDHVDEVIDQVQRMIDAGLAYTVEGAGIYFDSVAYGRTAQLARRGADEDAVSRLEDGFEKRNGNDFVVWKFQTHRNEPYWLAPFGAGRPGWHIEDTAITERYFGVSYDIHGGATDLIFPHHEAEIAQMESLSHQPLVQTWMHTGLLSIEGRKMGKSLKNFITVDEMLAQHDARTLRYAFLSNHYRSTMELSDAVLASALAARNRVRDYALSAPVGDRSEVSERFWDELLEDLNTPKALAHLFTAINRSSATTEDLRFINDVMGEVFELDQASAPAHVIALADARLQARLSKDWIASDELRNKINELGWTVRDAGDTYTLVQEQQ